MTDSANKYLVKYGLILLVVVIIGGAAITTVFSDSLPPENPLNNSQDQSILKTLNKTQVMHVVERGAGQECEWEQYDGRSGRISCTQEFDWKNQSYKVHDYFDVKLVNGAVEITQ